MLGPRSWCDRLWNENAKRFDFSACKLQEQQQTTSECELHDGTNNGPTAVLLKGDRGSEQCTINELNV